MKINAQLENKDSESDAIKMESIEPKRHSLTRKNSIYQLLHTDYQNSINIFLTITEILKNTDDESLKFTLLKFLAPLLGAWTKGH